MGTIWTSSFLIFYILDLNHALAILGFKNRDFLVNDLTLVQFYTQKEAFEIKSEVIVNEIIE